jgi:predicted transcriptional regulator
MKTKEKIIEKIQRIEDESILEDLLAVIDLEMELDGDTVELNDEQKSAVDEGLKDIEEGRSYSNEEAGNIIDEWMKKR